MNGSWMTEPWGTNRSFSFWAQLSAITNEEPFHIQFTWIYTNMGDAWVPTRYVLVTKKKLQFDWGEWQCSSHMWDRMNIHHFHVDGIFWNPFECSKSHLTCIWFIKCRRECMMNESCRSLHESTESMVRLICRVN